MIDKRPPLEFALWLFGLDIDATEQDIVSAFRRVITTVHPDHCPGDDAERLTGLAISAREVLMTPAAKPVKVDGGWHYHCAALVHVGDVVRVVTRYGKMWDVVVDAIVEFSGDGCVFEGRGNTWNKDVNVQKGA